MVFGCAPVGKTMRICPEEIFAKELTILGTKINPFTFPDATNLVANMGSKYIDYEKLGIGVYDLEDYQEALIKLPANVLAQLRQTELRARIRVLFERRDIFRSSKRTVRL